MHRREAPPDDAYNTHPSAMSFSLLINNNKFSSKDLWITEKESSGASKEKAEFKFDPSLFNYGFKAIEKPPQEIQYDQFRIEQADSSSHDTICTWKHTSTTSWITTVNNKQYTETGRCTYTITGPCDEPPTPDDFPRCFGENQNEEDNGNTSPAMITDYTHGMNKIHNLIVPPKPTVELERADCPWYICAFIDMI